MQTVFKIIAKSAPQIEKYTLMELKLLGIKAKITQKFGENKIMIFIFF